MSGALQRRIPTTLFDALGLPFRIGRLRLVGRGRLAGRRLRRGIVLRLFDDFLDRLGDDGLGRPPAAAGVSAEGVQPGVSADGAGVSAAGGAGVSAGGAGVSAEGAGVSAERCWRLSRLEAPASQPKVPVSRPPEVPGVSAEGAGGLGRGRCRLSQRGCGRLSRRCVPALRLGGASAAGAAAGVAAAASGRGTGVSAFVRRKAMMAARFLSSATPGKAIAVPGANACGVLQPAIELLDRSNRLHGLSARACS